MPHEDIRSRRFEIGSGLVCLALLAGKRGPLDPATLGAAASSAPDLEHVVPFLRLGGRKLFHGRRGWHRTGDVGHLDAQGRLWIEGRLQHVITTASGAVTPVGIEQRLERIDGVSAAAVVGVGPAGAQVVVAVVVAAGRRPSRPGRRLRPGGRGPWLRLAGAGIEIRGYAPLSGLVAGTYDRICDEDTIGVLRARGRRASRRNRAAP